MSRPYTLAVGGKDTKRMFQTREAKRRQRELRTKAIKEQIKAELRRQLCEPLIQT